MTAHPASLSEDALFSALRKGKIIGSADFVHFEPYPPTPDRLDSDRQRSFRVWKGDSPAFHLTAGPSLKALQERTAAFAKAIPELACRPLFFIRDGGLDFLGREYFGEMSLEEAYRQKKIDHATWQEAVASVKAKLDATSRPSSERRRLRELASLERDLLGLGLFSAFDRTFLREIVFPLIRDGASRSPARASWTNGDFIAKNILLDGRGAFRLIDYEFARETHFGQIDWFRLQRHSTVPPGTDLARLSGMPGWPPWLEILGWLEQAQRLGQVGTGACASEGCRRIAEKVVGLLGADAPYTKGSVFAEALGRAERQRNRTRLELEAHITLLDEKIARYEQEREGIIRSSAPADLAEAALRIRALEDALATLRQRHDRLLESLQAQNETIRDYESNRRTLPS